MGNQPEREAVVPAEYEWSSDSPRTSDDESWPREEWGRGGERIDDEEDEDMDEAEDAEEAEETEEEEETDEAGDDRGEGGTAADDEVRDEPG
jgi:hypothetical protein